MGVLQHVHAVMQLQANIHLIISSRVLCHLCKEAFRNSPRRTIMSFFRCPLSRIIAPGRPKRLMAGWKFHLAQLTKSFPTDFNYLGPRWNGPLLGAGVNATKYQKPWPRTDIIVRWPHDCLSPIMRWPQLKPRQTAWGGAFLYLEKCWNFGILRKTFISHIWNLVVLAEHWLGKPRTSKTDEFSEKFQTALDPPPLILGKSHCNFFRNSWPKYRL